MRFLKMISKGNSIILIACFFLPFIVPMCGERKMETSNTGDSAVALDTINDSTSLSLNERPIDSISYEDSGVNSSEPEEVINNKKEEISTLVKFIIRPDGSNDSGIGFIYLYSIDGFAIFSLPQSFILIIAALFVRPWKLKAWLVSIGLCCFTFFGLIHLKNLIYGYWVALGFYILAVILHGVVVAKEKSCFQNTQG